MLKKGALPPYLPAKYHEDGGFILREFTTKPADYFTHKGERRALKLFHEMARRVPAYKDFLKKKKINPAKITTMADFKLLPLLDKNNYLRKYPLEKLCWDGKFADRQWDVASTSGSTGEPFYFPRDASENWQYGITAELYLRSNFDIHKKSTLYVNCFALGVWIGGMFTYEALKIVSERENYRMSVINPGLNKAEIIKSIRALGPHFDQVIMGGYAPFVKDVLDDGVQAGLDWKKYNMRFVFSAEGFSEEFRDYVAKVAGLKNIYKDTLNHYGTVDQGTIAHETPAAIMVRRLAVKSPKLFEVAFRPGVNRIPTLAQYDPELFFFEEVNDGLVCSSYSGLPLVRYDLKDMGGIVGFDEMFSKLHSANVNLHEELHRHGFEKTAWHLPFVYVYERKDLSIKISGANVYPETLRKVLQGREFSKYITGKFTMVAGADARQNQGFMINIELKNGIKKCPKEVEKKMLNKIVENLLKENSEYRIIYEEKKTGAHPRLVFWHYEYPEYFRVGGKQKWALKLA